MIKIATIAAVFAFLAMTSALRAQSLDDQLFEDLQDPVPEQTQPSDVADRQFEESLRQELGDGEDVGARGENPLSQMATMMGKVRDRLAVKDTAAETRQIQKDVLSNLDALIEELSKKKKSGGGGGGKPNSKPKPQQPTPKPQSSPGKSQSPQETTTGGGKPSEAGNEPSRDELMQSSWGNLPPNVRQQMQSARPEKFLPKYAQLIEEYFQRLAEEEK